MKTKNRNGATRNVLLEHLASIFSFCQEAKELY